MSAALGELNKAALSLPLPAVVVASDIAERVCDHLSMEVGDERADAQCAALR